MSEIKTPQNTEEPKRMLVKDVVINNDSIAINLMAFMLDVAHRRGAFSFEEAGKINECLKYLETKSTPPAAPEPITEPVSIDDQQAKTLFEKNNVSLQVSETN